MTGKRSKKRGGNRTRNGAIAGASLAVLAAAAAVSAQAMAGGTTGSTSAVHPAAGNAADAVASATAGAAASASATPRGSAAATATAKAATSEAATAASTTLAQRLSTTRVTLPTPLHYLRAGYNGLPEWTRVDLAAAPNGSVRVAWPAANGVHVTPLAGASLTRQGADTVVAGAKDVSGLVAHNDGFALLTRVPDSNKWNETAAALIRYRNGARVFTDKLTGTASHDTSPVLDGQLAWNGAKYGAYFVVHGAGGFADGHFGDKLAYIAPGGARLTGGWDWGCSHNEGIALYPEKSGPFTSFCLDDWRSGLFVSTGISAPDVAPVLQREQCWAGYCGGAFPDNTGDVVKSGTGRYAVASASRGAASAKKNPADSSGRGWTVTPRWKTHQVAVDFLSNGSTPSGRTVYLTSDAATDHVNVHLAPYGKAALLVSWENRSGASCADGTCTGHFAGTHLRLIDYTGKALGPDTVVAAHISGDIAVLPGGDLSWAYTAATPNTGTALSGSPTTSTLSIARLKLL